MRFAVDAHAIGLHLTGNEVYIRNLLQQYNRLDETSEFTAYVSAPEAQNCVPARFRCRRVARNPYVRLGGDLSARLREDRPDLVHVQYTAPLGCPAPVVVSVHDVSFLEHPEYFPPFRALQLRWTVRQTVQKAARVVTPSEFSRQAILKAYRIDPEKVVAIPNAVSNEFRPRPREQASAEILSRYGIPSPFILTVGDLQPRKNQEGLILAFERLLAEHPELPHHLVLVGQNGWESGRVQRSAERSVAAERIHLTGFLSDQELLTFYTACELFAFPSFYEGFGLPILEAMASGRAVACSNSTAIPEVADACAILFDPHSIDEMTRALRDLVLDTELRTRLERLGLTRSANYNWANTARNTLDVYYSVVGQAGRSKVRKTESVSVSHS